MLSLACAQLKSPVAGKVDSCATNKAEAQGRKVSTGDVLVIITPAKSDIGNRRR